MKKLSFKNKFRSLSDYYWFVLRHQSISKTLFLIFDAVFLLVGLGSILVGPSVLTLTILIPVAHLIYGLFKLRINWNRYRKKEIAEIEKLPYILLEGRKIDLDEILPTDRALSLGYNLVNLSNDAIFTSDKINNLLWGTNKDWTIISNRIHPKRVSETVAKYRNFCIRLLTIQFIRSYGQQLFVNEKKFCLSSEIEPSNSYIKVHYGGYFSSFCTNEGGTIKIRLENEPATLLGGPLFPIYIDANGTPRLQDLNVAPVNNHVGITVLAITSDRHIVVWQQGKLNLQDPGKVVATGSGSADASDVLENSLCNTIEAAMKRELSEEALQHGLKLESEQIAKTKLLGFFRWIARAGKPEFIGLARLTVPIEFLRPDQFEVDAVTDPTISTKINHSFYVPDITSLPNAIKEIREYKNKGVKLSLPLKFILYRLEYLLSEDKDTLQSALYG